MRASLILTLFLAVFASAACSSDAGMYSDFGLKPRIVVLTDIAPGTIEPDDMESMVRLMTYADQFEIEALITSTGWNCDPYPTSWADSLYRVIDAYELDVQNLMNRSEQTGFMPLEQEQQKQEMGYWPSPEYLRSRVAMGSQRSGIGVIGPDNNTAGSELIISIVDEADERPVWITCWGGANTLAQAIWKVQQERSPEELKAFLSKLRVYTITDQDMVWAMRFDRAYSSHQWMRREFADDLLFIWDESAWLSQNELGSRNWEQYKTHIQGKANLGKAYPTYKWGVEGDTPSFLNVMPNGLHDPSRPEQIGWAGCFRRDICPDSLTTAWTNCNQPMKGISRKYEERFYPETFNDFAARMVWAEKGEGNRNPVIVLNGKVSYMPEYISVNAGECVKADLAGTYDPEGDELEVTWWVQEDAGTYKGDLQFNSEEVCTVIRIPEDAGGTEIHVICEVRDTGTPSLVSYRRMVFEVK